MKKTIALLSYLILTNINSYQLNYGKEEGVYDLGQGKKLRAHTTMKKKRLMV